MKIALIGKSAAGKDTIKDLLVKMGLRPEVSYTTRSPREGEIDGVSYHFMSETEFHEVDLIEKVCFNKWWYGTGKQEFDKSELFIFTPSGLALLPKENRKEIIAIYLMVDPKTQLKRLKNRGDNLSELKRRIDSDEKDFKDFTDFNMSFNTALCTAEEIADFIYTFKTKLVRRESLNNYADYLAENRPIIANENIGVDMIDSLSQVIKTQQDANEFMSQLKAISNQGEKQEDSEEKKAVMKKVEKLKNDVESQQMTEGSQAYLSKLFSAFNQDNTDYPTE